MCTSKGGSVASWHSTSEIGSASQTAKVESDMMRGSIQTHGRSMTPCRRVDRITATLGWPIDWK